MRLTKAVLLLLCKCLIFELVTSETLCTCPLGICTDLLKDHGGMETRLKALEVRLADSEAQIEELKKENRDKPKVVFSASLALNGFFGPVDKDTTLVYKNVYTNVGDAYNQATGIFTAPLRGVYYFSFFYHCGTKHGTRLVLYRNGKQEATAVHHKSKGSPQNGGNGLTLLLEKGDHVYVLLTKDKWIWDSDNLTVFTGFLINPM